MSSSILHAINHLRCLLTKTEKMQCMCIIMFALAVSLLEAITTGMIVAFAHVMTQPCWGQKYLSMVGFNSNLSSARIVFYFALIVGLTYAFKNFIIAVEAFYQNIVIQKMNHNFKSKLLRRYAIIDYAFYLTRNSALGLQIVDGDSEKLFSQGITSLANILSEFIVFLCLITMIIYMKPILAGIIFFISTILYFLVTRVLFPKFYKWNQLIQEAAINSSQTLIQFFHAFKEIIISGKLNIFVNSYQYYSQKKSYLHAVQIATHVLPRIMIEVLFVGLFVITIAFLCLQHESPMQILGILSGYLYIGFRLMPGLNRIINQLNNFKATIPSIEKVFSEYNLVDTNNNYISVPEFTFTQNISLNNISFRYPNTNKDVIKNFSFVINKKEHIGIIGETGSGKSTIIDIILGLLKPHQGVVLIDNKYVVNSYQWHKKIGYVPQLVYLLDDTIEANITFGDIKVDERKLNQVIAIAQLNKFVASLPQGVKTIVGERGIRLSGGERQRIAIARALYKEPEVLIFDEATSALDNDTELKLMDTINNISKNYTVIMIAHRLTTLKNCDKIIVLKNGSIDRIVQYQDL